MAYSVSYLYLSMTETCNFSFLSVMHAFHNMVPSEKNRKIFKNRMGSVKGVI